MLTLGGGHFFLLYSVMLPSLVYCITLPRVPKMSVCCSGLQQTFSAACFAVWLVLLCVGSSGL